jgi:hypothetical protein
MTAQSAKIQDDADVEEAVTDSPVAGSDAAKWFPSLSFLSLYLTPKFVSRAVAQKIV